MELTMLHHLILRSSSGVGDAWSPWGHLMELTMLHHLILRSSSGVGDVALLGLLEVI